MCFGFVCLLWDRVSLSAVAALILSLYQADLQLRDLPARCAPPAASKEFCFHVFDKCFWVLCILEYWPQSLRFAWPALYSWPVSLFFYLWILKWIIVNFGSSDEMTVAFEFHYAFSHSVILITTYQKLHCFNYLSVLKFFVLTSKYVR